MTITPYSLPSSSSRTRIVATTRLTTSSTFITLRVLISPVLGTVVASWSSYLPLISSTLITRLASPAMAAP